MKLLKLLRPALALALCVIAIIVCLVTAQKFETGYAGTSYTSSEMFKVGSYSVTDYSYYGGDAYTGMQQASADASNNVVVLGLTVTEAANAIYSAQKNAANNVAALAVPLNVATTNTAAIGSLLSTAMAFAFGLAGVKNLFDLLQVLLENKEKSAAMLHQQATAGDAGGNAAAEEIQA